MSEEDAVKALLDLPSSGGGRKIRRTSTLIEFIEFYRFIEEVRSREREAMMNALKDAVKDREEIKNILKEYMSTVMDMFKKMMPLIPLTSSSTNKQEAVEVDIK